MKKFYNCLVHPPLSAKSLTGRGFWVLERPIFGGKKGQYGIKITVIPNLFRNLFTARTHEHEMLKLYKMSQRGTICANLYAVAVQHNKSYVIASEPGRARQSRSSFCGLLRHFIPRNDNRAYAFTLAEVLITLVIVGVVAALTIPNLMTKYQQHVFENQFKKSLYTISQIVAQARSNLGVSRLNAYCSEYNGSYYNAPECANEINNYIKKLQLKQNKGWSSSGGYQIERGTTNDPIKTYNNKNTITYNNNTFSYPIIYTNKLADGSYLGFFVNNSSLQFAVDLNGNKKPNRLGYDIFIFFLSNKNDAVSAFLNKTPTNISDSDLNNLASDNSTEANKISFYGSSCNLHSERPGNGLGCSYYALRNKCPYDDTKTYWECLK